MLYFKLAITAIIPAVATLLAYHLSKLDRFKKMKPGALQILIGIFFGAVSIIGTEFGVAMNDVTVNTRDAAPLCAGLIFGAPAGIIAGVIGGVERWFAASWGAGEYSRVACSVSTVLAGIIAALLRKYMFDDKRPAWPLGLAVGSVMETLHMTLVFVTHAHDSEAAFEVVKLCAGPMILLNSLAVMLSIIVVQLYSIKRHNGNKKIKNIAQQIQTWLIIIVIIAFLATTAFVYRLQTNSAMEQAQEIMTLNIKDIKADIEYKANARLTNAVYNICSSISETLYDETLPPANLINLSNQYVICNIDFFDPNGIVIDSSVTEHIGFDRKDFVNSILFDKIEEGDMVYYSDFIPDIFNTTGQNISTLKYVIIDISSDYKAIISLTKLQYKYLLSNCVNEVTQNRHVGKSGFALVADSNKYIMSPEF
ncbi:MAG: hypothetical protein IJS94_03935, partial [Clostridia bacterium]|nr:hypothetical protein [Clostridia bacterium]